MIHWYSAYLYAPEADAAFFAGNNAPDTIGDRLFKDRFHFRDVPDRKEALKEWARAHDLNDPYTLGFLLHLYTDILWDDGPQAELRTSTDNSWFKPYRAAIHRASCKLYRDLPWAQQLWDSVLAWTDQQPDEIRLGIPMSSVNFFLHKTYKWHNEANPEDYGYYTRPQIEQFSISAVSSFKDWLKTV